MSALPYADVLVPASRGLTPREAAQLLRVSPDRIRAMIASGELGAVNMAPVRCGKPRYVILPHHLTEYERRHRATAPAKSSRRPRRRTAGVDFYPDP
jgi:hypothetical protein